MSFSPRGAVDLSSLAANRQTDSAAGSNGGLGSQSFVVDVTEQNFQSVVQGSLDHLVVMLLWSPRSPQGNPYNDQVAALINTYQGKLELARVDVDANPQISQALSVQAVPTLIGLVKGQPVPLIQGTAEESQLRTLFDELVTVGVQNGVTGRAQPSAGSPTGDTSAADNAEPVDDPRFAAADEAFAAGDFNTAIAEYEKLRANHPTEDEIVERLAGVKLMQRTHGTDVATARQAAADNATDIAAQLLVADLDISGGHVEDAFDRLITLIKQVSADEREPVRERIIELFTVVGSGDSRVAAARRALAAALY